MAFIQDLDGKRYDDDRNIHVFLKGARESTQVRFVNKDGKEIAAEWFLASNREPTNDDLARYSRQHIDRITVWHFSKAAEDKVISGYGKLSVILEEFVKAYEASWPIQVKRLSGQFFVGEVAFDDRNWQLM